MADSELLSEGDSEIYVIKKRFAQPKILHCKLQSSPKSAKSRLSDVLAMSRHTSTLSTCRKAVFTNTILYEYEEKKLFRV